MDAALQLLDQVFLVAAIVGLVDVLRRHRFVVGYIKEALFRLSCGSRSEIQGAAVEQDRGAKMSCVGVTARRVLHPLYL
jgi:hypothetical protein